MCAIYQASFNINWNALCESQVHIDLWDEWFDLIPFHSKIMHGWIQIQVKY